MSPRAAARSSFVRAQERLQLVVEGEDATSLRTRVLDFLFERAEADAMAFQSFYSIPGGYAPTRHIYRAYGRTSEELLRWIKLSVENADAYAGFTDLRTPSAMQRRMFLEDDAIWDREMLERSTFYARVFAPATLAHQQRLLAYHGDRFVGWIGALRTRNTRPFTARDRRPLQPLVAAVVAALTQADQLEREETPGCPADLVVDATGHVEYASTSARAWLAREPFRLALTEAVRNLDRGADPSATVLDLAETKWTRLEGENGRLRYLAHVVPMRPVRLSPLAALTTRQRQVAELAAAGLTVDETAQEIGARPHTVRDHLKEVYRKLAVANRSELAHAINAASAST